MQKGWRARKHFQFPNHWALKTTRRAKLCPCSVQTVVQSQALYVRGCSLRLSYAAILAPSPGAEAGSGGMTSWITESPTWTPVAPLATPTWSVMAPAKHKLSNTSFKKKRAEILSYSVMPPQERITAKATPQRSKKQTGFLLKTKVSCGKT